MKRRNKRQTPKDGLLSPQELRDVRGGIGTWPTPERPMLPMLPFWKPVAPVAIDTVPLPE